jgi:hypothetical protein
VPSSGFPCEEKAMRCLDCIRTTFPRGSSGFGPEGLMAEIDMKTTRCRLRSFRATSQICDAAHNLKVAGSNPAPATNIKHIKTVI